MKTPLYTEQTECRDCYKCVRSCPVKAIRVQDHHALAESERCIVCGNCVQVCPAGAQHIRTDIPRVKQLLKIKKAVYLSLAPSFPAEFAGTWRDLLPKLKKLGFTAVSETAHGADLVSFHQKKLLETNTGVTISTACPTVVELITRYYPELIDRLSPIDSPMMAHANLLRETYGNDIGIVFAGPCAGKKIEADSSDGVVDVAITFVELAELIDGITVDESAEIPAVIPCRPARGVVYPIDGGMVETLRDQTDGSILQTGFVALSGLDQIMTALDEMKAGKINEPLFCEFLACEGGCINGSGSVCEDSIVIRKNRMTKFCREEDRMVPAGTGRFEPLDLERISRKGNVSVPVRFTIPQEQEILKAWESMGKSDPKNRLDCGGCGYNSCREFAIATLTELAEPEMCVTAMRKQAQNKVNALIKTIPMGVVLVNRENRIVDCNDRFVGMFIGQEFVENTPERFRSLEINRFVPVEELIRDVQGSGVPAEKVLKPEGRVLRVVLFPIEHSGVTGLLFQDITAPSMKRETVIRKAEEVIHRNLQSVQQIASLLGENAAETEIILTSLIDAFNTGK